VFKYIWFLGIVVGVFINKRKASIDGFVLRRSGDLLGGLHNNESNTKRNRPIAAQDYRPLHNTGDGDNVRVLGQPRLGHELGRQDISESLNEIDNTVTPEKKLSRRQRRQMAKLAKKPRGKLFRIFKRSVIVLLIIVAIIAGFFIYKSLNASHNIFQGNILDIFSNKELKMDANGRSNFLVLGTSEDDPNHDGANLTDSMLIISINQKTKDAYMFSVPRDLYVDYGMACFAGYSGKINAYFSCSNEEDTPNGEQARLTATQKLVGDIFGLDIQYGAHVNHTVIKEAVDAVGGVDVDIQGSNGDPGVYDRNFDWRCNYKCYLVKYDNGVHHLDGEHALYLAQARGDVAPTYGLGNSNFDREKNQQKILIAIKDKAMSTGTLTNLGKISGLIDALGDNLRTNIQMGEVRTLMQVASETKPGDVHTVSLVGESDSVVKTGSYGGASVVIPSAGVYDYSEIQNFIKKSINSDPVSREAAPIVVLNGTGQAGVAQTKADILTAAGFSVTGVDNAPDGTYGKAEIYQIGTDNVATADKLAAMFNVVIKKTAPPSPVNGNVRFVIIFGAATS